jgi:hypothetical protein
MHKLAFLLKPYGVRPRQNDARTARGYHAATSPTRSGDT